MDLLIWKIWQFVTPKSVVSPLLQAIQESDEA